MEQDRGSSACGMTRGWKMCVMGVSGNNTDNDRGVAGKRYPQWSPFPSMKMTTTRSIRREGNRMSRPSDVLGLEDYDLVTLGASLGLCEVDLLTLSLLRDLAHASHRRCRMA